MKKLKIGLYICGLVVAITISAADITSATPAEGEDCSACHAQHKNDEYKQLTRDAINSGRIPCFACHSEKTANKGPATEQEFETAHSRHPLNGDKECLICHELNDRHNDGQLDEWPNISLKDPDPEDSHVYSGAKINNFCLSCHDNSPITLGDPPRTPIDLSSAYEFTGHGRIDINEPCNVCHEHHASQDKPYLIKDAINDTAISGNDNSVCFACHAYSRENYPGKTAYLSSEHGMQGTLCIDCHNPHGDNKDLCYLCHNAKYSAHYSTKRDKLCVDCHNPHQKDGLKMQREDEEKLCFMCHRELEKEFGNIRDGISGSFSHHKVDDEEYGGGRLECNSCHNPHTVTKFNIVSDPDSRGADMMTKAFPEDSYNFKTVMYDDFCLKCHDGSRVAAKDIRSELSFASDLETGFTADGTNNLHKVHRDSGFGCQNCHNAHSSEGTNGIRRGALLHEEMTITNWDQTGKYREGKNSCSGSSLGMGCH